MLPKGVRLGVLISCVVCTLFVVLVRFTSVARLEAVTINGKPMEADWSAIGLARGGNIIEQPVDMLSESLIAVDTIHKVAVMREWPHALRISVNEFEPCAMILDSLTGIMYGVDTDGRVIPSDRVVNITRLPILTGLGTRGTYRLAEDPRLSVVLPAMQRTRMRDSAHFPLLATIDFSHNDYLTLSVEGLPYRVRVAADRFEEHFSDFVRFTGGYDANLETSILLDMRYSGMIVCTDTLTRDTAETTTPKDLD